LYAELHFLTLHFVHSSGPSWNSRCGGGVRMSRPSVVGKGVVVSSSSVVVVVEVVVVVVVEVVVVVVVVVEVVVVAASVVSTGPAVVAALHTVSKSAQQSP